MSATCTTYDNSLQPQRGGQAGRNLLTVVDGALPDLESSARSAQGRTEAAADPPRVDAEAQVTALVALIRSSGSAATLLREHTADHSGHCPRCSSGGDSSGKQRAPCSLYRAALVAQTRPDQPCSSGSRPLW